MKRTRTPHPFATFSSFWTVFLMVIIFLDFSSLFFTFLHISLPTCRKRIFLSIFLFLHFSSNFSHFSVFWRWSLFFTYLHVSSPAFWKRNFSEFFCHIRILKKIFRFLYFIFWLIFRKQNLSKTEFVEKQTFGEW